MYGNQRLKMLREDSDLKQKALAEMLNISRATYAGYENNLDSIPLKKLNAISNFYNVSLDYLCNLSNDKTVNIINKEIDKMVIADNLKKVRTENKDSQRKISKICSVEQSTYCRYELGKRLPLTFFIIQFANHYKISIDWLCGKTDNINIK